MLLDGIGGRTAHSFFASKSLYFRMGTKMTESPKVVNDAPEASILQVTKGEEKCLQDFWSVYEAHRAEVMAR